MDIKCRVSGLVPNCVVHRGHGPRAEDARRRLKVVAGKPLPKD